MARGGCHESVELLRAHADMVPKAGLISVSCTLGECWQMMRFAEESAKIEWKSL